MEAREREGVYTNRPCRGERGVEGQRIDVEGQRMEAEPWRMHAWREDV